MSEGRALTNAIGNSVATLAIAKWQGELDEDRLERVLRDPGSVDELVERALRGERDDADAQEREERFTREPQIVLPNRDSG
jgi:aerobic C4-dicarboxylate transport protein